MTGYSPRCGNCHTCMTCRGNGVVTNVTYELDWRGKQVRVERKDTCRTCRGVGGRVGVGPHQHR